MRAPSLGEANDNLGSTTPANKDPEQKKTAFSLWRSHGVATMEVSFKGVGHLDFAQADSNAYTVETKLKNFEYYTRAWFDRFLRHDATATARLMSTNPNGTARADVISAQFISGAFLPGDGIDCPDLSACV